MNKFHFGYTPRTKQELIAYLRVIGAYDCRLMPVAPDALIAHVHGLSERQVSSCFTHCTAPITRGEEGGHELVHALSVLARVHPQFTALLASIARRIPKEEKGHAEP